MSTSPGYASAPAFVNALAVGIGYLLLRRLVRPAIALVAALLWATTPYLVAHGRLLHLDGLLTSFATLSLLATLNVHPSKHPLRWLATCGCVYRAGVAHQRAGADRAAVAWADAVRCAAPQGGGRVQHSRLSRSQRSEHAAIQGTCGEQPNKATMACCSICVIGTASLDRAVQRGVADSQCRNFDALACALGCAADGDCALSRGNRRQRWAAQRRWSVLPRPGRRRPWLALLPRSVLSTASHHSKRSGWWPSCALSALQCGVRPSPLASFLLKKEDQG
ncbi:glycosyltransferase family 39 protein [Candidatus Gracilibacteria bacterium]|nr:glycosyltransferase family 39 protein [Candidatus Gracilibacteria bacterium]